MLVNTVVLIGSYMYISKRQNRLRWLMHCPLWIATLTYTFMVLLFQFTLSSKDLNLTEFRLDFYRIVNSHEHYVTLNLPLGAILYPMGSGSAHSSPSGELTSHWSVWVT